MYSYCYFLFFAFFVDSFIDVCVCIVDFFTSENKSFQNIDKKSCIASCSGEN